MATDSAPTRPRHDPTRNLWQWPTFLAGAAFFCAAWQGAIPMGSAEHAAEFRRNLTTLQVAAESAQADAATIRGLIENVETSAARYPDQASLVHYAVGSGYARLADVTAAPAAARELWTLAQQHLEQVKLEDLPKPSDDGPRLAFRSAKTQAGLGFPGGATDGQLTLAAKTLLHPPQGEQAGEAYRLAGEIYLKLTPPALDDARKALDKYLTSASLATPSALLARGKLRLSETYMLTQEVELARRWLTQIGPDSPPEVLLPAKAQLARIHMKEGAWANAAKQWEQVRASANLPEDLKAQTAYQLGLCLQALQQPDAAAKLFEEVAGLSAPERFAATVKLAELKLRRPGAEEHTTAAARLTAALQTLPANQRTNPPLIPANEVQATFEQAIQTLQTDGAFEAALAATEAYASVAAAGRDREKRAEVLEAWGQSLSNAKQDFKPKLLSAATNYLELARVPDLPAAARADRLRRAADLFRKAENRKEALDALGELVKLPDLPEELAGNAWGEYAEVLLESQEPQKALKAFQQAILNQNGAMAARYKLARLMLDSGDPARQPLGLELLKQISGTEKPAPGDLEYRERALVELGQDALKRGDFAGAENSFRKQLGFHPAGNEANLARFLLGVCLLQQTARQPGVAEKPDAPKMREEALDLFRTLVKDIDARKSSTSSLNDRDLWLRTQASLRVLQALQQMDRVGDVIATAATVRLECKGRVEELIALSMMYHAQKQANRPELARQVLDAMQMVYQTLPDAVFQGGGGEYSKEYWERVWFNPPPAEGAPALATPSSSKPQSASPLAPATAATPAVKDARVVPASAVATPHQPAMARPLPPAPLPKP